MLTLRMKTAVVANSASLLGAVGYLAVLQFIDTSIILKAFMAFGVVGNMHFHFDAFLI